ncbi:MAG: ABC transporter ATP-binding protein [Candidatus Margulisiibacteriota bacterium]
MFIFIKHYPFRYWPWYLAGLTALILTTFVTTLIPIEIMHIIDSINQKATWLVLKLNVKKLIGLALILAVARTLSRILIFTPGRYVEYDLRKKIHSHLLTLSPQFFRNHTIGDTMSRMINDIQALRLMSAFGFLHIVNTTMIYSLVIYQMVKIHPVLTAWVLTPVPFALLVIRLFVKRLYKITKQSQQQLGQITDFFVESVANMSIVKTFNAEDHIIKEMQKDNERYRNTQISLARIRSTMFPFIATIGSIGQIILLYQGGQEIIQGALTIGQLVAFSSYLALLAWPTAAMSWIINIIQRGLASLERINDILDTASHPQYSLAQHYSLKSSPSIEVKNLSFSYTDNPILSNISFKIPAGKTLGIFGPTGSGKTTLAQLIALNEPLQNGQILFDGHDCTSLNVLSLRNGIAMVPQRRFLFSAPILDNVLFSNPSAPFNIAESAVQRACVHQDIELFPESWKTMVGEKGIILSGGQQHRLAMARGYASDHYVLILDDVLSSVDHETETKMIHELFNQKQRPTTILVAHRISALKSCDHIIVIDQGRIIAQGSHDDLIAQEGIYQSTWQYQQLEVSLNESI